MGSIPSPLCSVCCIESAPCLQLYYFCTQVTCPTLFMALVIYRHILHSHWSIKSSIIYSDWQLLVRYYLPLWYCSGVVLLWPRLRKLCPCSIRWALGHRQSILVFSNRTESLLVTLNPQAYQERERVHSRLFKQGKGKVDKDKEVGGRLHSPVVIEIVKPTKGKPQKVLTNIRRKAYIIQANI